jgi:GNAT superfamily N-acetyltransferase
MPDIVDLADSPDPSDPLEEQAYAVLRQLRTELEPAQWALVRTDPVGARPTFTVVVDDGAVTAVAAWRVQACTHVGRQVYVDDLVTDAAVRSRGHGELLLQHLRGRAETLGCSVLSLDSGVERYDAHRFYLRQRMAITAHHFTINV